MGAHWRLLGGLALQWERSGVCWDAQRCNGHHPSRTALNITGQAQGKSAQTGSIRVAARMLAETAVPSPCRKRSGLSRASGRYTVG